MKIELYDLIEELRTRKIYFEMTSVREDYIMLRVDVPGEKWEIEYSKGGEVEIEIFRSDGNLLDESAIDDLFERHSDFGPTNWPKGPKTEFNQIKKYWPHWVDPK